MVQQLQYIRDATERGGVPVTGLLQAFQEDNGNPSSMRLMVGFVVVTILGTWSFLSIKTGAFVVIPTEVAGILLGSLGIKAWQKGKEEPAQQSNT